MKKLHLLTTAIICFSLSSCNLSPDYKTPKVGVSLNEKSDKNSQISWENFFENKELKDLIKIALKNNDDILIANLNIESARQIHGIARSKLFPTINAGASQIRQGVTGPFAAFTPERIYSANINFTSFELDFFGRLRNLKKFSFG